jgi:hypothetical protein
MSQLIGFYDDGYIQDRKGRTISLIRFRIVTREGTPEDLLAHCLPPYKDAIVQNLQRLLLQKDQDLLDKHAHISD